MMDTDSVNTGEESKEVSSRGPSAKSSGRLSQWVMGGCSALLSHSQVVASKACGCVFAFFLCLSSFAIGSEGEVQQVADASSSVQRAQSTLLAKGQPALVIPPQLCHNGATGGGASPSQSSRAVPPYLQFQIPTDGVRQHVTTATLTAVQKECSYRPTDRRLGLLPRALNSTLSSALRSQLKESIYYSPKEFPSVSKHSAAFLPEGAAFAVTASMDYNGQWQRWNASKGKSFIALYAVAINLRPSRGRSRPSGGEIKSYLEDMQKIINSAIEAAGRALVERSLLPQCSGGRHVILPAFGAGAFLRNVTDMRQRLEIVNELANMLARASGKEGRNFNITFHICLARPHGGSPEEVQQNYKAFKEAFEREAARGGGAGSFRMVVEEGVDGAVLAQDLADRDDAALLLIAGNNGPLGNHWFDYASAKRAQEENVHRRSGSLAVKAFVFNGGLSAQQTLFEYSQFLKARHVKLRGL